MSLEDRLASPPQAPEIRRRVRLHPFQWVGAPLLMLVPVLALFGVFGESWDDARVETATLGVTVEWPTRFRYKQLNEIRIRVENRTTTPIDTITIVLEPDYAAQFSTVRAIPSFDEPYSLALTDVMPGDAALAIIEIQAERYGRHEGQLTIGAADTARIRLHTTIFP